MTPMFFFSFYSQANRSAAEVKRGDMPQQHTRQVTLRQQAATEREMQRCQPAQGVCAPAERPAEETQALASP